MIKNDVRSQANTKNYSQDIIFLESLKVVLVLKVVLNNNNSFFYTKADFTFFLPKKKVFCFVTYLTIISVFEIAQ